MAVAGIDDAAEAGVGRIACSTAACPAVAACYAVVVASDAAA